ncbi:MAG: AMMECR1 domain-containing protein [Sulfurimonas sp.]|uniref:AMMECR1 domain-containing protein n=1 Tax=Sulfurimonas sp. TaxID=2022749 RepID=UPI00260817D2|nr:AMMECR1 domain-containing protein [Sulfurimonas sp.]MCW8896229.1 AMMECR1 domain-containing protein [Sulfurimonas sp.]MCW8954056.1 AMMECR1 domain-containing protein [Sulfurimonas sp.]MCW9068326.1 AMMECR1 domain-containing protein [Sulfurimonas sp.]
MSRSVLLQIARDSIQEVLEANRTIDKQTLLREHPLLNEKIATTVNIYLDSKLRGSSKTKIPSSSLLEDIIRNAKISAFEDKNFSPITTSQYLHCEIELLLTTPDGVISEKDPAILKTTTNQPFADFE